MARRNRWYLIRTDGGNSALVNRRMVEEMQARYGGQIREYQEGAPLQAIRQGRRVFLVPA